MQPLFLEMGRLPIYWYGVMMALGFLAGLVNWIRLGRGEGRDASYCSDLLFWVIVSGIVGARLSYVLANLRSFALAPLSIFRVDQGGLIYYGGFIAAGTALFLFARARREKLISLLDFVITSVPLGHAFGRIGCLMNGCCYGRAYNGWPSITFPAGSLAWWHHVDSRRLSAEAPRSLPVHPVQLYEATFNLALFFLLGLIYRRRHGDGRVLGIYLIVYPAGRFLFEHLRVAAHGRVYGFSDAQYLSILLMVLGIGLLVRASRLSRRGPCRS